MREAKMYIRGSFNLSSVQQLKLGSRDIVWFVLCVFKIDLFVCHKTAEDYSS